MKLKSLLTVALIGISGSAFAQSWMYDSVAMGAGYANDAFYGIKQGTNNYKAGNEWDIAFQMTAFGDPQFNASVRANQTKKGVEVYSLNLQASTHFGNLVATDSVGKTSAAQRLSNYDTSWGTGAFYQNRKTSDPFSYGWGNYDMSTHYLTGDSLYLIKVAGGGLYQFWLEKYISTPSDSIAYLFHVAKFDNSSSNVVKLYRKSSSFDFSSRLFAYYDLASNTVVNHEPAPRSAWDMMFTQYMTMVPGPNGMQPYSVTGVLTNLSRQVTKIIHTNPDDLNAGNFMGYITNSAANPDYTTNTHIDQIGYDWKSFNMTTNQYTTYDSGSYILKIPATQSQEYWQLQFIRFDGSAGGGKILFRKRLFATVGVASVAQNLNAFAVAPNPASNDATVMLDAKTASAAQMVITDMAGRVMQQSALNVKAGVNAYGLNTANWPAGIYAVQVAGQDWKVSSRLVVAH